MPEDLAIRCKCGKVRGVLQGASGKTGNRAVCYCDDCQRFADFLSTDNGILDANGGTDILQVSSNRLKITQGNDHLKCLRVTPKGVLRWYTDCCRTPVGNTLPSIKPPFVGLIHSCMDPGERSLDEILGPVKVRVMGQYARGNPGELKVFRRFSFLHIVKLVHLLIKWHFTGDYKITPFFNPETGKPVASPEMIENL